MNNEINHGGYQNYKVQSVIFNKKKWDQKKANRWLKNHQFKTKFPGKKSPHITKKFIRYRQLKPIVGTKFRIKKLNNGIDLILMYNENDIFNM